MPSLLLTGATGLVGARLLPRLVDAGFDCRALVRRDVALPDGVTAVRGDLDDPATLPPAVTGVDAVVHLAALFRTGDDEAIRRANFDGTRHLIKAVAAHAPTARVVMASTSNVYDASATGPSRESDECSPTAAYPASKVAAEALLRDSGLTWSILRLPFVYGDGDGHLASLPTLARRFGLHPAHTYSVAHHRDVAVMIRLALSGGRTAVSSTSPTTHPSPFGRWPTSQATRSRRRRRRSSTPGQAEWMGHSLESWASGRRCQPSAPQPRRESSERRSSNRRPGGGCSSISPGTRWKPTSGAGVGRG